MRSPRRKLLACVVIALVALGLGAQSLAAATTSHCTSAVTREAIVSFIAAFNRGDYESLDTQFAPPADFEWYSSGRPGLRLGSKSRDRDTLLGYFRARHRAGDRLGLVSFGFNGDSGRHGNFELELRRSATGFRDGEWFRVVGKGALICGADSTQFIVMSLGGPEPPRGARRT